MDLSFSDRIASFLPGIDAVVRALPQAALVVDGEGAILVANTNARRMIGPYPHESLRTALKAKDETVFRKLRRLARTSVPGFVRLEFADEEPTIFHGSMLRHLDGDQAGLILLVADNTGAAIGKTIDMKSDTTRIKQQIDRNLLRNHELRKETARLKRLCEIDPMTGVLNVRAFEALVKKALTAKPALSGALVFVDVNAFKRINDLYGHAAGDKALKHVAKKLTFPPKAGIATGRVGGDEFALWLPGVDASALPEVVADIRARAELPLELLCADGVKRTARICLAMGTAFYPDEAKCYDTLKQLSDRRMYSDKGRCQESSVPDKSN